MHIKFYFIIQDKKDSTDLNSDLLESDNGCGFGLDAWEGEEWLAGAERLIILLTIYQLLNNKIAYLIQLLKFIINLFVF